MKKIVDKLKWLAWIILCFLIGILGVVGLFYLLVKFQVFMGWDPTVLQPEKVMDWFSHV